MGCSASQEDETPETVVVDRAIPRVELQRPSKSAMKKVPAVERRRVSWATADELKRNADEIILEDSTKDRQQLDGHVESDPRADASESEPSEGKSPWGSNAVPEEAPAEVVEPDRPQSRLPLLADGDEANPFLPLVPPATGSGSDATGA
jgi:hypothetical protein